MQEWHPAIVSHTRAIIIMKTKEPAREGASQETRQGVMSSYALKEQVALCMQTWRISYVDYASILAYNAELKLPLAILLKFSKTKLIM